MKKETLELLWIGAFRYYCGRMTISVHSFCEALKENWDQLPERAKVVIQRDLDEIFERDDIARTRGGTYKPLGHDCDRESWESVRNLINNEVKK